MEKNTKPPSDSKTLEVGCHPSHETRISMSASSYDEICMKCGHTDIPGGGWGKLAEPCPNENGPKKY